jgi:aminoglycoside phosphotransferase
MDWLKNMVSGLLEGLGTGAILAFEKLDDASARQILLQGLRSMMHSVEVRNMPMGSQRRLARLLAEAAQQLSMELQNH